ncbi:MAG TPA: glycosyltransferase family 2 protein [Pyrinomonadaceae bacterium]|nr:glycosyltransferase family 2 protein [Pyrinomonadaceae bacterium]
MLDSITPLILTYNEAANIGRTLEQLRWARDIVVVDSFSDDETIEIAGSFPHVRVFQRKFDNHATQWNFGLSEAGIATEWVLALDADYVLTTDFVDELRRLEPLAKTRGYEARFTYCIAGRRLRGGVYPPVTVLYRKTGAVYSQDGHTHRLILTGEVEALRARILHDDRKPLGRWFESQQRYMTLEAQKLLASDASDLSKSDRIRRLRVIAPLAVLFYCLIVRGGVLDGWAGFYYAFQRMLAELLLSLYLIEDDFNAATAPRSHRERTTSRDELVVSSKQQ